MNLLKKTQSVQKKAKNLGERSIEKVRPIENLRWKILFKLISNYNKCKWPNAHNAIQHSTSELIQSSDKNCCFLQLFILNLSLTCWSQSFCDYVSWLTCLGNESISLSPAVWKRLPSIHSKMTFQDSRRAHWGKIFWESQNIASLPFQTISWFHRHQSYYFPISELKGLICVFSSKWAALHTISPWKQGNNPDVDSLILNF